MEKRRCANCNKPIIGRRRGAVYCSESCRFDYHNRRRMIHRVFDRYGEGERTCARCGRSLAYGMRSDAVYCGERCRRNAARARKV
jgi:predicted nucleic acid-binding Zn ribbon protein